MNVKMYNYMKNSQRFLSANIFSNLWESSFNLTFSMSQLHLHLHKYTNFRNS